MSIDSQLEIGYVYQKMGKDELAMKNFHEALDQLEQHTSEGNPASHKGKQHIENVRG